MIKIIPEDITNIRMHKLLQGAIGPRPIAFASTMDAEGSPNLSPFSFFNVFGVNPTTLIFSPSRRNRDNTTKNTYENVKIIPEVVINVVTNDMVHQVSLASTEYPRGVDEFIKAGFTKVPSEQVRPFRVKESPIQIECKVRDVIETSYDAGAANLVICQVLVMHMDETILADDGLVDQQKLQLVGRMGRDWYCKAFGDSIFHVQKPLERLGMGIDGLPEKIRRNEYLTGNELGKLGNLEKLPETEEIENIRNSGVIKVIYKHSHDPSLDLIRLSKNYLEDGRVEEALKVLMLLEKS